MKCCCETFKKIAKVFAVIAAIAAAGAAIYFAVTKFLEIKGRDSEAEDYVSCSCCDDEPILVEDEQA